jgi:hypothetical protein
MKKPTTRAAVIAGTSLLAATLLTGCAGEKHTYSGLEVSKLDKTIEALDASWSQHRANGIAATVEDSSRCFVQTSTDGVLADKALCGPVHYLGDDETVWESVGLQPGPDGKDKITLAGGNSFDKDKPNANTVLYRTDGKKASENTSLAEPDTKAAEAEKALWDVKSSSGSDAKSVNVITPDGTVHVSGLAISTASAVRQSPQGRRRPEIRDRTHLPALCRRPATCSARRNPPRHPWRSLPAARRTRSVSPRAEPSACPSPVMAPMSPWPWPTVTSSRP